MPTVTISRPDVSLDQATTAIKAQMGSGVSVEAQPGEKLRITQGNFSIVHVRVVSQGGSTIFHVHGGGLIIGRLINELTIARKVADALKTGLAGQAPS